MAPKRKAAKRPVEGDPAAFINILREDHHIDDQLVRPCKLISLYEGKKQLYMETATVDEFGNPGAFLPMTREVAIALGQSILNKQSEILDGYVPPNLIYFSYNFDKIDRLLWWTPPQKRFLRFLKDGDDEEKAGWFKVPYLIWSYKAGITFVYAATEPPTMKTKLFHAPFYNINKLGAVCMGSGQKHIHGKTMPEFVTNCENAFWETSFTHPHNENFIKSKTKSSIERKSFYKSLIGSNKRIEEFLYPYMIPKQAMSAAQMMAQGNLPSKLTRRLLYEDIYGGIRTSR